MTVLKFFNFNQMIPKYIIIHHSAVSRENNSEQFDAIQKGHIRRGFGSIGYHFFVEPSGNIKIGRMKNKIGAHCKSRFMNFKSIGICLAGNFEEENPTEEQILQLKNLVAKLRKEFNIPANNVRPHRAYAYTACPGERFTDKMIRDVANNINNDQLASSWAFSSWKWAKDNNLITKNPHANVTKEELAVVLNRFSKYLKK